MSKKNRLLTNKAARKMAEDELTEVLCNYYSRVYSRSSLTPEEKVSLRKVAQELKNGDILWSSVEDEIANRNWDALKNTVENFRSSG